MWGLTEVYVSVGGIRSVYSSPFIPYVCLHLSCRRVRGYVCEV